MPVKHTATATPVGELKRRAWVPTGAIDESTWIRLGGSGSTLTSGTLQLVGNLFVPAGRTVSSISFQSQSQGVVTPSNQWFCLVRTSDLSVLGKTSDDTTAGWGASTWKTLSLSTPWTADTDTAVYAGCLVVAATTPNLAGTGGSTAMTGRAPALGGNSTTGLTNPASLGATATTPTGFAAVMPYCYIS
jgi:hypothetical protein